MTVLDFVRLTRANVLLLLATVALGILGGFLYTQTQPVIYKAQATGYVAAGDSSTVNESFAGLTLANQKADAYLALVNSRQVGSKVVEILGRGTPGQVAAALEAYVPEGSPQLKIVASSDSPQGAKELADAAMRATAAVAMDLEMANLPAGSANKPVVRIETLDDAVPPGAPASPNSRRNLAYGAVAGLALGYLIALLRKQLDNRVRHVEDVEALAQTSVLGVIPVTREIAAQRDKGFGGLGVATESFRHLRTNLRFVDIDRRPRSIVITSANPGEGKSSVSANLARVLAQSGQPTVIVDADLRRPMLATLFGLDGTIGLTQVIAGDVDARSALIETDTPGLSLLPAGRIPPNPSELLGSQRMRAVVDELTTTHLVILDAPPLLPVTDAGLLSAVTDGAMIVIATGRTRKEELALCAKIFGQVGGRLLGAVMNLAPTRGLGSVLYGYGYGGYTRTSYYDYAPATRTAGLWGRLRPRPTRTSRPQRARTNAP